MLEKTVKNAVQKGCTSLVYRSAGPITENGTDIRSDAPQSAASVWVATSATGIALAGMFLLA
jgi:hypothetical protein